MNPSRILVEEQAVDSYQNLLFSILRFHVMTKRYPSLATIISYDFKRRRFLELHAPAIQWPDSSMIFYGIDPPHHAVPREILEVGESKKGYKAFETDPYGVGEYLWNKRKVRGWKEERVGELWNAAMGTSVLDLLLWSGGESWDERFPGQLPWQQVEACT